MKFIGREKELKELKRMLNSDDFQAALIYGRRRVGKTELIKEAVKDHKDSVIFFVAEKAPFQQNVEGLARAVTSFFHESYLQFNDLDHVLEYVFMKSVSKPVILIIDEYSFLRGDDSSVDSKFQIAIDRYHHDSRMKLILCGSYMDVMKQIVDANEPLFGRFTSILYLKPFDYYDASKFFPNSTSEQKLEWYSCFGGIPFYLNMIDPKESLQNNLERLLIPSGSILENEIVLQMNSELSKIQGLNGILSSIGQGLHSFKDLNKQYAGSHSGVNYSLNKLLNMDLVEKSAPINDPNNAKQRAYYIADNLLDFYYTFLHRQMTARTIMDPGAFYREYIKEVLKNNYLPAKFEAVTREYLIRKNRAQLIEPPLTSVGRYVYHDKGTKTSGEFDAVSRDKKGWTLYECKYQKGVMTAAVIAAKKQQAEDFGLDFYRYGFVSKNGFGKETASGSDILVTLDDLYDSALNG